MRVAKIGGIQVKLNSWFILLILLFCVAGMASKVLLVFTAVLWHELAHAKAAILLGCKVQEVELLPFGGVARIEGLGTVSAKTEMMIAAAGPAASLVLAVLAYIGMLYTSVWPELWEFYFRSNSVLAIFNLLPGLPLDGGRILRAWLAMQMDYSKATYFVVMISQWLSLGFLVFLLYDYVMQSRINITFLVAAVFLYTTAKSESKIASFRTLRILGQKKTQLMSQGIMGTTYFTVMNHVRIRDIIGLFTPDQYYILLVVDTECKLCGTLTETAIWEELSEKGLYAEVREFI